ncbi:hypothetical protein DUI87_31147 [Hirundo rustica rustica]|uniref:separase n=1 Tax=Hirundo rustica rustica TaxID=333673 RepID=A0A3M0IWY7_HIRRU|nr:hypothetical protein DUI87_31147 [Hirundo rustica rustica]
MAEKDGKGGKDRKGGENRKGGRGEKGGKDKKGGKGRKDEKDREDGKDGSTDGWAGFEERVEKMQKSLQCLSAPRSHRVQTCDRVLRACVEELARPGGLPAHGARLLLLVQETVQHYLSLVPEPPHLYLEKMLFHVLRNAMGWLDTCAMAELLRERLRRCRPDDERAKVIHSTFSVLWTVPDSQTRPEGPRTEDRRLLASRIRAVRFLLLLESQDCVPQESFQPPFFTSQSARTAAAAASLFQAESAPCWAFLAGQFQESLLNTLRTELLQPLSLSQSLCFLELTRECCRHLCKAQEHREALATLEDSKGFLGADDSLGALLELLEAGAQLSWALSKGRDGQGAVGPALCQAGAALAVPFYGRALWVLVENSRFVLAQLGEVLRRSQELPLGLQELPGICAFSQGHGRALQQLLAQVPSDSIQDQVRVKQLLFHSLQLFSNAIHEIFQRSQPSRWLEMGQVTSSCAQIVTWMLDGLDGLPEAEKGKFLNVTAAAAFCLGQAFQSQNIPQAAGAVCKPFCQTVLATNGYSWPGATPEKLHRCFQLHVESWRRQGQLQRALGAVVQWLQAVVPRYQRSQGSGTQPQHSQCAQPSPVRPTSLVLEPMALWVRLKMETVKQGKEEELQLRSLQDILASQSLSENTVLLLLLAELQAYKSLRCPTGPERYKILQKMLGMWDPERVWRPWGAGEPSGIRDPSGTPDPNCSLPRAVALLELGQVLCSHSSNTDTDCSALDAIQESLKLLDSLSRNSQIWNSLMRDQLLDEHAQALLWLHICTLEDLLEKSLARERRGRLQSSKPLDPEGAWLEARDGIRCSLSSDGALSKPLDEAFSLWKQLLEHPRIPEVRSLEQTICSLQILAALYRLQEKPIQALESFLLLRSLCQRLGDNFGMANSLCQISRVLLELECPLQTEVDQAVPLLLKVLQEPQAQRATRSWLLARAQGLQVVATILELPPAQLGAPLRERIQQHGLALVHKWQVLGDILGCCQRLVTLLGHSEVQCRARAFCSEGLTVAGHLQAARWCTLFLVLQSQLELQQGELQLSQSYLQDAQFLLQPQTGPEAHREPEHQVKVQLQRGGLEQRRQAAVAEQGSEEDEGFLQGPSLHLLPPAALPEQPDALTASPELKRGRRETLEFLCHGASCACSFCSDPALVALGLRWLLAQARALLAAGEVTPGLAQVRRVLELCDSASARLLCQLRGRVGGGHGDPRGGGFLGPLAQLVAAGYSTLAQQSLPGPSRSLPVWDEELERGLILLGTRHPPVAGLGVAVATLLMAKAVATLGRVAAALGRSMDNVLAQAWTPQLLPTPQKTPNLPKSGSRKTKAKKTLQGKPSKSRDVVTLKDSDTEVPPIVLRPGGPCTPHPKSGAPRRKLLGGSRTPFTIFCDESSPPGGKSQLCRAPKAPGRTKSRIRVVFSDSDSEEPQIPLDPPKTTQKYSSAQRVQPPKSPESSLEIGVRPRRGRPRKELGSSKKREKRENLEKNKEEMSFKPPLLTPGRDNEEIPELGRSGDPPNPEGSSLSAQPGVPSLDTVRSLLAEALAWVGHFPPGSLYGQLCQLLALTTGDRDPLATAGLLAESLSVTTRHQMLSIIHARTRKKRKAAAAARGDISDQLQGLSLQEGDSQDSQSHLAELQELFQFSSAGLVPAEQERFREQLQKIPRGVTVCQLSLASAAPGALGDTLLLTRLQRGAEPLSVRIATQRSQAPLSRILQEFELIQREQREANVCTERQEWWERRSRLDLRMQSLIQSLDQEVLGCWRGLLLPRDPRHSPLDQQELSRLLQELRACGWDSPNPALLQALLAGLRPADVRALALALCPARPCRAQLLLDEALERCREGPEGSAGSLVLLLDKHLQRLPWESSGTLRNIPVTRLPALRFVLCYSLQRQRSSSVLKRGVNPQNTFYVLNPQRDLVGTEERFRSWFESYAGHGAGARLLEGQNLARLRCRAVVLLFGCSSAALSSRGHLEPTGTVLRYILAGCPLVLGNLWDVTDRDLDRLAQALLWGWLRGGPGTPLLAQLAQARQAPKLRSLIGAAPVVYGLPVNLS